MWRVTTNAIDWETFPGEELALIRAKIDELAAAGLTDPGYILWPITLPDGEQQRQRDFTTLAAAEDYGNLINELPSDLCNVISITEVV
jgi:hypothetical protein